MKTLLFIIVLTTLPILMIPCQAQEVDSTYVLPNIPQTGNVWFDKLAPLLLPLFISWLAGMKGKVVVSEKMKGVVPIIVGTGLILLAGWVSTGWLLLALTFAGAVAGIFGITGIRKFYWNYSGMLKSRTITGYGLFLLTTVATAIVHTLGINIPIVNTILMIIQLIGSGIGLFGLTQIDFTKEQA